MDGYVGKPVRPRELFEALAGVTAAPKEAAPPAEAEAVLDEAELLDRVEGDWGLLREVVEAFLDTYPGTVRELRQALAARDAAAVQRLAHTLKGMVGNLGAKAAFAAAVRLEGLGRAGDLDLAESACATLDGALARLRPALDEFLARDQKPAVVGPLTDNGGRS